MEIVIDFVKANWTEIGVVLLGAVVIGERAAAYTENKLDDKIFAVLHKLLVFLKLKFPEAK